MASPRVIRPAVVTAFYDIGRGNWPLVVRRRILPISQHRSTAEYFNRFSRLAVLQNAMVVFTTDDLVERVERVRALLAPTSETTVIATPPINQLYPELIGRVAVTMDAMQTHVPQFLSGPHNPEYWNPAYVMVNVAKPDFVCRAYRDDLLSATTTAAWIDFGYCNNEEVLGTSTCWEYGFDDEKIHLFALHEPHAERPIFDVVRTGAIYITGGQIVAGRALWGQLRDGYFANLECLLKCGLVDDDQTLLLMCYLESPSKFQLHLIRRGQGWRVAFRQCNRAWVHKLP